MLLKQSLWFQIATAIQILFLLFGFVYMYPENIDFLALILFIFYLILLLISLNKNQFLLQMAYACFAYLIIMPFLIQSSDQKYMAITGGVVQSLDPKTFWIFIATGILLQFFYWIFAAHAGSRTLFSGQGAWRADKKMYVGSGILPLFAFSILYSLLYFGFDYEWMLFTRSEVFLEEISSFAAFSSFFVKSMPSFVALVVVEKAIRRNRRPDLIILLISYLLLFVFNNPVNTPRFLSLGCLILPTLPYLVRGKWLGMLFVFFPAIMSVLLPATSLMRDGLKNVAFGKILDFFGTAEFSAMFVFNDAIKSLGETPLALGNHTLSALLVFIPRTLWPTKNSGTGIEVAESLGYRFTNVGIPPLYDFYLDFGYSGVVIFSLSVAALVFRIQKIWDQNRGGVFHRSLPFLTFILMPIFLRGDFSTACVVAYSLIASSWFVAQIFQIQLFGTKKVASISTGKPRIS